MDDLISRRQAVDALRDYLIGKRCFDDGTLTCRLIENEVINKLPSAEPQIIRCKDCMNYVKSPYSNNEHICSLDDYKREETHYCGYAERRTDG